MLRWPLVSGLRAQAKERATSVKAKVKTKTWWVMFKCLHESSS